MSTTGVLDDYLQELLLDSIAPAVASASCTASTVAASTAVSVPIAETVPRIPSTAVTAAAPPPAALPQATPAVEIAASTPAPASVTLAASELARATAPPRSTPQMPPTAPPPPAASRAAITANKAWNELQAQAQQAPREQQRRAAERTSRWLRLRCGAQAYALELLKVQEVVLPVPLLALRGTGNSMLGIMNLRGQVVPVIDLGLHLGANAIDSDANTRIVVLEENGETLGLRVSAVEDVTSLTDSQIEPPDTTRICQISNELLKGIARLAQRPMILLDATRLLH